MADPGKRSVNSLRPSEADAPLRLVYKPPESQWPSSVCLVRQTTTLLIANFAYNNRIGEEVISLVALSRDALQQWLPRSELRVTIKKRGYTRSGCTLCELAESTVLFAALRSCDLRQLRVMRLTPAHQLTVLRELQAPGEYNSISTAVINGRSLVAFTLTKEKSVSLYQLLEDRLQQLSHFKLETFDTFVLWSGEHLLLAQESVNEESLRSATRVVELDTSRVPLARASELLPLSAGVSVTLWCADGERVCVYDFNSDNVLVYSVR